MANFSNVAMSKKAASSSSWTYIGHYGDDTNAARAKAVSLFNSGKSAFYKRIIEKGRVNYHVYTFV